MNKHKTLPDPAIPKTIKHERGLLSAMTFVLYTNCLLSIIQEEFYLLKYAFIISQIWHKNKDCFWIDPKAHFE